MTQEEKKPNKYIECEISKKDHASLWEVLGIDLKQNPFTNGPIPMIDLSAYKQLEVEITQLKAKLETAKEALRFYGDSNNYNHFPATSDPHCGTFVGFIEEHEAGAKARAALKEIEGE